MTFIIPDKVTLSKAIYTTDMLITQYPMTLTNSSIPNDKNLRICTWNVRGIMSSAASLSNLLVSQNIDIAFITEHKLFNHSKYFVDTIQHGYRNITVFDENVNLCNNIRCGKGGVCIMYKSYLDYRIKHINESINDRICGPKFTYVTMESMLDHIIISNGDKELFQHVEILDDDMFSVSDHLPVFAIISVPFMRTTDVNIKRHIAWHKLNQTHISAYEESLTGRLQIEETEDVNVIYNTIIKAITSASQQCLPHTKYNRHAKPYWAQEVKSAYNKQREARQCWIAKGQPRGWHHESYATYKRYKRKAAECDNKLFWSLVKSRKHKKSTVCSQLSYENETARDPESILEIFTKYFKDVYTPLNCDHFDNNFKETVEKEVHRLKDINGSDVVRIRQGGILSTWIYNLFINGLLELLERSNQGTNIINIATSNTTLADDIALSAISPSGLQNLLNTAYEYTCKFRYMINSAKSFIMIFGDHSRNKTSNSFYLGHNKIEHTNKLRHVGVQLNDKLTDNDKVTVACRKAEASFYSMLSLNVGTCLINPLTSAELVSKICVSKLLFEAELWNNLSKTNYLQLERFIRMAAKLIQRFPIRTRIDICLAMLGMKSIESQIDIKKLTFLECLCNMPVHVLSKQIFNLRLAMYACRTNKITQRGYIPDIINILSKYNLLP
ncbi:hypothetical protein MAR_021325, partial [Mya arenaria]